MITHSVADGIATVTIRRSEKLNCLRAQDKRALADQIDELGERADVDAMVVTGDGDRAFCVGSDIDEMRHFGITEMHAMLADERAMYVSVLRSPKPVVAAVNGYALGAGLILSMVTDYSVASTTAQFGAPELSIGVAAPLEGLMLPYLVGLARARELFYLCERLDAGTARNMGLINGTAEPGELRQRAAAIARRIGSLPSDGFRVQKALLYRLISSGDLDAAITESHYATSMQFADSATGEAMSRFLGRKASA
jgi:enoyl-CoA hydratase